MTTIAVGTAAILLGASQWPKSPDNFVAAVQFANSSNDFRDYLLAPEGLGLPSINLLDLFDDPRPVSTIDEEIDVFLRGFESRSGIRLQDLLIYYVGHGTFTEGERKYCLPLRSSRFENLDSSAYRIGSLALTLQRAVPRSRRYVIIDACYSAAATGSWIMQSAVAEKIQIDTMDAMAESGTALLCAAGPKDVAIIAKDDRHTMFSGALLRALWGGWPERGEKLSFEDVRLMIEHHNRETHKSSAVRSQMHIPDQRTGDISKRGFFPNAQLSVQTQKAPAQTMPPSPPEPRRWGKRAAVFCLSAVALIVAFQVYKQFEPNFRRRDKPVAHATNPVQLPEVSPAITSLTLSFEPGATNNQIFQILRDHSSLVGDLPDAGLPEGALSVEDRVVQ